MWQGRWMHLAGAAARLDHGSGVLRALDIGGRTLLVGMYCDTEGGDRLDLRDARTGEVLDVAEWTGKEWWHEPAEHLSTFVRAGDHHVVHQTFRPNGYRVLTVTPTGFGEVRRAPSDRDDWVSRVAPGVLDGRAVILTCDEVGVVRFRDLHDGDRVLRSWRTPEGWSCDRLVAVGGRAYSWLGFDVPDGTPFEDRWRVAAAHGQHLWDVTSGRPVGAPLLVRGYRWGPWSLGRRLVALFKVDWRDVQLWDVTLGEPVGPGLGDLDVANPAVGLVHGRAVLVATTQDLLRVWDAGTGRQLAIAELPDTPIGTAIGPGATVWAITRSGHVAGLGIAVRDIHPSAVRRLGHRTVDPGDPGAIGQVGNGRSR